MTAYATAAELATFTDQDTPDGVDAMLERASEVIDDHTRTAVYAVDGNDLPTDAAIIAAFRDSTCAQVEFWMAGDVEDDILGPVQGVVLSGMQLQYGAGANRITPLELAPRAARILRIAGLYRGDPVTL